MCHPERSEGPGGAGGSARRAPRLPGFLATLGITVFSIVAFADPPTTCGTDDTYGKALCAYQQRDFKGAESGFRAIADAGAERPETIRSMYFLGRTLMKQGKWQEASGVFIRIYELDRTFYNAWSCDFLLGECRRALGKG